MLELWSKLKLEEFSKKVGNFYPGIINPKQTTLKATTIKGLFEATRRCPEFTQHDEKSNLVIFLSCACIQAWTFQRKPYFCWPLWWLSWADWSAQSSTSPASWRSCGGWRTGWTGSTTMTTSTPPRPTTFRRPLWFGRLRGWRNERPQ